MKSVLGIGAVSLAVVLASCSNSSSSHSPSHAAADARTTSTHAAPSASASPNHPACSADVLVNHMSLPQQVGQLFMVGTPTASNSSALIDDIGKYHVGGAFLFGHSQAAASTISGQNDRIQQAATRSATDGVKLLISTDQEGGLVQVLHGSGFGAIPNALTQAHLSPQELQAQATTWGRELKDAGITMNLAPVADDVLPQNVRSNAPIGQLKREYGATASTTNSYATAFARGMAASGVIPTAKHFPGLGNVHGNTDFSANVHDATTSGSDPNLTSYVNAANTGGGFVMMSSATYDRIDSSSPAVFSPKIVNLLRAKGFHGPIITDDFAHARAVSQFSPADRAIRALSAGVDVILLQDDTALPAMYAAVLTKADHDPKFAATVKTAASAVLATKGSGHLLPSRCG